MKTIAICIIFLLTSFASFCQNDSVFVRYMDVHGDGENYRTDTLFTSTPTENHYLVGTMMLPGTSNQISGYEYGLWSSSVAGSACEMSGESELYGPDQILDVEMTDSTLIINCKIMANCCHDFLCDFQVDENGILNLIYHGYGDYCACNCCFGLTYSIGVDRYDEEMPDLTGIMINGSDNTLKRLE